jgi:hypothetical protein
VPGEGAFNHMPDDRDSGYLTPDGDVCSVREAE